MHPKSLTKLSESGLFTDVDNGADTLPKKNSKWGDGAVELHTRCVILEKRFERYSYQFSLKWLARRSWTAFR